MQSSIIIDHVPCINDLDCESTVGAATVDCVAIEKIVALHLLFI